MKKLVISVLLVNLLAACASEKPKETAAGTAEAPAVAAPAVAAPETAAPAAAAQAAAAPAAETPAAASPAVAEKAAPAAAAGIDQLNDQNSILSNRSTHYPFDVSVVQEDDKPLVQAHAKYLSEHSELNVRLEGNCDERGSNEYNLALGQRRADSVKKMLQLGGAKASQIKTVSYGEEKPKATGHNEDSWKQNRRTDIVY
jgi:peptidoglycan-associated lipoprotein